MYREDLGSFLVKRNAIKFWLFVLHGHQQNVVYACAGGDKRVNSCISNWTILKNKIVWKKQVVRLLQLCKSIFKYREEHINHLRVFASLKVKMGMGF